MTWSGLRSRLAARVRWSDPDRRWMLLSHALVAVTLSIPTFGVVVDEGPASARLTTVAIALGFAVWYGVVYARADRTGMMVLYAAGALALFTVLTARHEPYYLLAYSLIPQLFSALPRGLAVLGVVGIFALPVTFAGGWARMADDPDGLLGLLATIGLGLVITAVIDAFGRLTEHQHRTIGELEAARAEITDLLARARRDVRERDALARAGHALIAARDPGEVVTAIARELADHAAAVRGVALLATDREAPGSTRVLEAVEGAAGPPAGADLRLPRWPDRGGVTVLAAAELGRDDRTALGMGVPTVALLSLDAGRAASGDRPPMTGDGVPADLLWMSLGVADPDEAVLRDLSTVATETALALANLRLAAHAAERGRAAGVLEERQRLAHEIHDTLAQAFASVVTQLEAAEQALATDPASTRAHVDRARHTARDGLREARRTVAALRPQPLERAALPDALRTIAERWRAADGDGPSLTVIVDGQPADIGSAAESALLRVAQEALTNIGRHARAQRATVTLSYLDDLVLLDVQDDGVGFDANGHPDGDDADTGGYGLIGMRERVARLGGELLVESAPGEGTTIAARLPLAPASHDEPR